MTDMTISGAFEPTASVKDKLREFRAALKTGRTPVDRASYSMLHLQRSNLEVRLHMIDEASLQSESQKKIYKSVEEMLAAPGPADASEFEWDEVCKIERLIALLYNGVQLREEVSARLQQLAAESPKDADALRRDHEFLLKPATDAPGASPDESALRMLLLRIMEALHWSAKKKYLARPIQQEGTKIILYGVLIAFLLIVAPYLLLNFVGENWVGGWWSVFALYTALTSGLMGAFFSRLIDAQRQGSNFTLDEVSLQSELSYTLLRAGVGMCGALVIYFFLRSDFMSGPLFPVFEDVAIRYVDVQAVQAVKMSFVLPSKALALLTFWCFIAGFSEKLVPSILASTEQQLSQSDARAAQSRPRS